MQGCESDTVNIRPKVAQDKADKLKPIKTVGGHRKYKLSDLEKFIGEYNDMIEIEQNVVCVNIEDDTQTD